MSLIIELVRCVFVLLRYMVFLLMICCVISGCAFFFSVAAFISPCWVLTCKMLYMIELQHLYGAKSVFKLKAGYMPSVVKSCDCVFLSHLVNFDVLIH